MRRLNAVILPLCLALVLGAGMAKADITGRISVNIPFKFHLVDTTIPPGKYTFHMMSGSDLSLMTIRSVDGNFAQEFLVRTAMAAKVPHQTKLIFYRYNHEDFLKQIFEAGSQTGVSVAEPSREELRLQKRGVHPFIHSLVAPLEKVLPK